VDFFTKPDLVKGEHRYTVFVVAPGRSVSSMDISKQLGDYKRATKWGIEYHEQASLWIVALHPTIGILDSDQPHPSSFLHEHTAWDMSDELSVVRLESNQLPEALVFEDHPDGRRAVIEVPWGHLLVLPDEGVVLGLE
jgi:hypothetical protein